MKKIVVLFSILVFTSSLFTSCKKDDPTLNAKVVDQFIYDGMSLYYLWADEMKDKKPGATDPGVYFQSLLNATDKAHGWSWITNDVQALKAQFSGTPVDFGYELNLYWSDKTMQSIFGVVKYVYPNTPASEAGIVRGNIIKQINGQSITQNNYGLLFGNSSITLSVYDQSFSNPKDVIVAPRVIETNPVFYSNVYNIDNHKIAYLFYTGFIPEFNNNLYNTFNGFKQQGVTDLILDLRYNHGGAITAATYLSSLIAPRSVVENKAPFSKMLYNSFLTDYFNREKISNTDNLGVYDTQKEKNPLDANLNLSKVYIIATDDSYSASELTTFCLRPYLNVVHVGDTTGGKYTASITIHAYDQTLGAPVYESLSNTNKSILSNWAMQPIVAKYTNKDGVDFSNPGYLIPDYPIASLERTPIKWKPIGDVNDYLLANAISLITTGKPSAVKSSDMSKVVMRKTNLFSPLDNLRKQSVILDNFNMRQQRIPEIMKMLKD